MWEHLQMAISSKAQHFINVNSRQETNRLYVRLMASYASSGPIISSYFE
jgi:hypothetical protein